MSERLLDYDPFTGEWVTFDYNHSDDSFTIAHHQDTTRIIEDNKQAKLDTDAHKRQAGNDWAHYAKVPNIVIMEWLQKHGVDFFNRDHWPKVMSLINSREYADLRRTSYFHDR